MLALSRISLAARFFYLPCIAALEILLDVRSDVLRPIFYEPSQPDERATSAEEPVASSACNAPAGHFGIFVFVEEVF